MKKYKAVAIFSVFLLLGLLFTACGSKKADVAVPATERPVFSYQSEKSKATNEAAGNGDFSTSSGLTVTSSGLNYAGTDNLSMEKIITKVSLEVETRDFDNLVTAIKDDIARLGGYEEKTEISGNGYRYQNTSRYAYIVARIPKDRLNEFVETVKENGNVINESSTSENVTLQYVDTESRKRALEIEQERLFELLEKTESLEDIVTLESRLSSIRHELQMYETELRTIDNQVEYCTVTMTIYEVDRITPVEGKETIAARIKNGFGKTIYNISEGMKDFVVWFVVNLPYMVIWAVVILAGLLIWRKIYRKVKMNKTRSRANDIKMPENVPDNQDNKND